jgi:CxxC motif-containing protein (DUF1111 family)
MTHHAAAGGRRLLPQRRISVKSLKLTFGTIALATAAAALMMSDFVRSQDVTVSARSSFDGKTREERFRHDGRIDPENAVQPSGPATEAPVGFDNRSNGFTSQSAFDENREVFEEAEEVADGLGPTYNGTSCVECHQNVVTGGASQVAEHRTGRMVNGEFFESLGGSLVHSRATNAAIVERVAFQDDIRTFRISTNTLGDGFVEAISNSTLLAIRDRQPASVRGTAVIVPVLESTDKARVGRFGWKGQHASLQSFSADAYLNEMGITSPLFPQENSSSGTDVAYPKAYDPVRDPEDDGGDVLRFADFMRATKAPARGPITPAVTAGQQVFARIGCEACHTASITTAPAGTSINGGTMQVPTALGNKVIHPYSDFLLHNIGSGDGIPVLPGTAYAATASQIRTAPLWGLRTRNRLMHDGLSFTLGEAIRRHGGQASGARTQYNGLGATDRSNLLAFLNSL